MAKKTVVIGDTGQQMVDKLDDNFTELYTDKHDHANIGSLNRIDGTTTPTWNGAKWPGASTTYEVGVTTPFLESISGTAQTQSAANMEVKAAFAQKVAIAGDTMTGLLRVPNIEVKDSMGYYRKVTDTAAAGQVQLYDYHPLSGASRVYSGNNKPPIPQNVLLTNSRQFNVLYPVGSTYNINLGGQLLDSNIMKAGVANGTVLIEVGQVASQTFKEFEIHWETPVSAPTITWSVIPSGTIGWLEGFAPSINTVAGTISVFVFRAMSPNKIVGHLAYEYSLS